MKNPKIPKSFISLISGGFDSPVASYLMMKRGFRPIFLSFLTFNQNDLKVKEKIIRIVQKLSSLSESKAKLYLIKHEPTLEIIRSKCARKLTCVICKRMMLRIARQLAIANHTNLLVTGDILGEQASQTLDNLRAYNEILKEMILIRPLIGFDKLEVMTTVRELGLYEIISEKIDICQFNPQYPETHAKPKEVENEEGLINWTALVKNAMKKMEILEIQ